MADQYSKISKQLCWNCKRTGGCKGVKPCPWALAFKPIKGWEATPTVIREKDGTKVESYDITECPLFIKDKEFSTRKEALEMIGQTIGIKANSVAVNLKKSAQKYEQITGKKVPLWVFLDTQKRKQKGGRRLIIEEEE